MIAEDTAVIDRLDTLQRMSIHAANGVRDEGLPIEQYTVVSEKEQSTRITAIPLIGGVIILTDRPYSEDFAWAGREDDQEILDELVEDGQLAPVE